MKFGFLTDKKEINCKAFSVVVLPDLEETLQCFRETAHVSNGWLYGPEVELPKSSTELKTFKQRGPINCRSFYTVQPTHEIKASVSNEEYLRFLILGYGFLQGVYLSPEGYSYLGRVPYEPGKLNGLILTGNDRENGMEKISRFYQDATKENKKQAFAVLHWFLVGQTYTFEWDQFEAQYKVLDGIYKLATVKAKTHAGRPVALVNKYQDKGIILPKWAELDNAGKSALSILRNQLVHEAKYAGHPIGYELPTENYPLEFVSFNTKLICAVLGIDTPYLKANPEDRQCWAWDIKT